MCDVVFILLVICVVSVQFHRRINDSKILSQMILVVTAVWTVRNKQIKKCGAVLSAVHTGEMHLAE